MEKERTGIIHAGGKSLTLLGDEIKVGQKAPNFTVVGTDFKPVTLDSFKNKTIIISIFPSIDTGVCATQTREFNKRATSISDDVIIISISKDLPFALGRFCGAESINRVHTYSDFMHSEFGLKYGFLIKENMLLARGVIVIDKKGIIKYIELVPELTEEPNYNKALNAI